MRVIAALVIGYLLGSVLPAYLIGRARGVDLRLVGSGNAGTTNAYQILGLGPALVTVTYDVLKGILAMLIAWRLGMPDVVVYAAGLCAWLGHHYPFYLGYHGAEGAAVTAGLLVASAVIALANRWLTVTDFVIIALVMLGLLAIFRRWPVAGIAGLSLAYVLVLIHRPPPAFAVFLGFATVHQLVHNVAEVRKTGELRVSPGTRKALTQARVLLRPAALAFPILYLFVPKPVMVALVGAVTLVFVLFDVARLASPGFDAAVLARFPSFFRERERQRFSSATLFLLGTFLAIFLFPKAQATLAIIFVTIGDLFAKYAGLEHGRTRIFSKTAEGSLAYFVSCAVAGFVWSHFVVLAPAAYLLGAAVASLTELAPLGLDDNFTVPLLSGAVMTLPAFFGVRGF